MYWFIRSNNTGLYASTDSTQHTISFIDGSQRGFCEIFKFCKTAHKVCSSTLPRIYVAQSDWSLLTVDPYNAYVFDDAFFDRNNESGMLLMVNGEPCHLEPIIFQSLNLTHHLMEFETQGFTLFENVLSDDEIHEAKQSLDIVDGSTTDDQIRRGDLLSRSHVFQSILLKEQVLIMLQIIMGGNNFKCSTWSSNTLMGNNSNAHKPFIPLWHVDYPYHEIPPPWSNDDSVPPLGVQTLWMLDDFTKDNGATYVIPKSQTFLRPPTPQNIVDKEQTCIQMLGKKGSVVISHGSWWHSQGVNNTQHSRTCLLGTFTPRWIKSKDKMESSNEMLMHLLN